MRRLFPVLLALCFGCKPTVSPSTDLASPSQATRDATAKILRSTAKPPPKSKWFWFTLQIRKNEDETKLVHLLQRYNLSTNSGAAIDSSYNREYQLDDYWSLDCLFSIRMADAPSRLESWKLVPGWRSVYIRPSRNYTGSWVTYFANGQTSGVAYYKDGNRNGEYLTYYPDGAKSMIANYANGREMLSTAYYHSGRIQSQLLHTNGIETHIVYGEDGRTNFMQYTDLHAHSDVSYIYDDSGRIAHEWGTQLGISNSVDFSIDFNEDGTTNRISVSTNPIAGQFIRE